MKQFAVKVTNTPGQTRITIPKVLAEETGLNKAVVVMVEVMGDKSIKIWGWPFGKEKEERL